MKQLITVIMIATGASVAKADPSDLCLTAARQAASGQGVPPALLVALTQTETGRSVNGETRPWPWTVNLEGEGHWFPTRAEAESYAQAAIAAGRTSFDVGCFQVNYRWHGQEFDNLQTMFDPATNAAYAARFVATLRQETGSWRNAAGAYHSRTPAYAERYLARFDRYYAEADTIPVTTPHENFYPLLRSGTAGGLGSLVPLNKGT